MLGSPTDHPHSRHHPDLRHTRQLQDSRRRQHRPRRRRRCARTRAPSLEAAAQCSRLVGSIATARLARSSATTAGDCAVVAAVHQACRQCRLRARRHRHRRHPRRRRHRRLLARRPRARTPEPLQEVAVRCSRLSLAASATRRRLAKTAEGPAVVAHRLRHPRQRPPRLRLRAASTVTRCTSPSLATTPRLFLTSTTWLSSAW